MAPSLIKREGNASVGDLGDLKGVEFVLTFEQKKGGLLARARNAVSPADPDLIAGIGSGHMIVDSVSPKERRNAFNGTVRHLGDGRGDGSEVVVVDITQMLEEDSDIDSIVLGGKISGEDGFSRVAGVNVKVFDTSGGERKPLGTVRFDIESRDKAVYIGRLTRTPANTWLFHSRPEYGSDVMALMRRNMH